MAAARAIHGVTPDMPFGAFAALVITVRADEATALLSRRPSGAGPELVHDRRVAIRRLRTALEVFGPALPKRDTRKALRELKQVFAGFGDRRDADVHIAALRAMEPRLTAGDRPGWHGLIVELDTSGGPAPGAGALPVDAEGLAAAASTANGGTAAKTMQKIAHKRLSAVRSRLPAVEKKRGHEPDALHELRIAAKRLRYVLEVAVPVLGNGSKAGVDAARSVQDVLGEIHDCDVLLPRIRDHRRALRDADVAALLAGRRAPNAMRYRGVQVVDAGIRARREELVGELVDHHQRWEAALDRLEGTLA